MSHTASNTVAPPQSILASASSASASSSKFLQFTQYALCDHVTCLKLFNRINALTQHPLINYENSHVILLQYTTQRTIQGRAKKETFEVKMFKRSRDPYSVVRWLHDPPMQQHSKCDLKYIDECKFIEGQGLWFLQSLGATLKNEYVECNVVEYRLENGIEIRVFQLGKCQKTLDLSTLTLVGEAANQFVLEVRAVAQIKDEKQVEEAMEKLAKDLEGIVTLSKRVA